MLTDELIQAYSVAANEHNNSVRSLRANSFGTIPQELKPWEATFLARLYSRDEFDGLCTGPDQHLKFAKWAVKNRDGWMRIMEREVSQLYWRCEAAATTFPIAV